MARNAAMRVALAAIRQAGTGPHPGGAKPERPDGAASGGTVSGRTVSGGTVSGCTPAERRNAAGREERDHVMRARARAALEPAVALLQRSAVELFTHMAEPPTRKWPYEGRTPAG
ncbi:hypothetical protein ACQPZZ_28790 [Microbispora sp. CA-135349]|uniref:hypothetical protein n=1 Tax=Microbispora sp. CA-135349 TaxID=3239953 RepID=UPI003D8D62AE